MSSRTCMWPTSVVVVVHVGPRKVVRQGRHARQVGGHRLKQSAELVCAQGGRGRYRRLPLGRNRFQGRRDERVHRRLPGIRLTGEPVVRRWADLNGGHGSTLYQRRRPHARVCRAVADRAGRCYGDRPAAAAGLTVMSDPRAAHLSAVRSRRGQARHATVGRPHGPVGRAVPGRRRHAGGGAPQPRRRRHGRQLRRDRGRPGRAGPARPADRPGQASRPSPPSANAG